MTKKVSIIIAVGVPGKYIEECVAHCLELDWADYEIIVLPDNHWEPHDKSIRVIPTGKVRPAEKRDRGVQEALGEIAAIIDDDAYPVKDWLKNAVRHFDDPEVAAVGGPAVTPPSDNILKKISGWIYESPLVSGGYVYRYKPGNVRDVDDYPTSNLLIRKSDFIEAGGFETGYWPGEDTILCLKLTYKLGKRIVYDPGVKVFHHRRDIFGPHLRQIKSYAYHRGFFVKKFPETSLKPAYFVPSLFAIFSLFGLISMFAGNEFFSLWAAVMGIYSLLNLAFSLRTWNPIGILGVFTGTFLTHIVYGVWFIAGLLVTEIKD